MNYIEYKIECSEEQGEIYVAFLGDMGFDSFCYENGSQLCYILDSEHADNKSQIKEYLDSEGAQYVASDIETKNWNKEWESNFSPITVGDRLCVRAPFHEESECESEIIIMPKMSFGTGHHATTYQMLEAILDGEFSGKSVLDMGCGSAILAILAAQRGAKSVVGIDIDDWAVDNSKENVHDNGYSDIVDITLGDASAIGDSKFDIVLANINRNILIRDMAIYRAATNGGGRLYVSGFLEIDANDITSKATELGYTFTKSSLRDGWMMLEFKLND